ncbi:hypothetical protein [Lactobacillus sp. Sy-1]|uniref:hypothetical protein n=1 Tax=Lactobacillus sp. Sy-1 TaxID=2109645 RepID=UPI001C5AF23D|nr:hypothetical protein [Lactobacillus sp. Sy-1]MBW1606213.1 hypothetical protein [Lactobacillus sp. Sy-1]
MNRFYDAAMQIQTGHYNYFQSFFGFQQSGRSVNALYGPLFAYLNGALLLITKTWYRYQIASSFLVLFISGSLMYRLAVKNHVKGYIGIIIAMLYMMSDPVMAWVVGQQFTGWGAAFLPLALLMGTEMVRNKRISIIKLSLAMALLLQVHFMTSLMAALSLVPFFLVALYLSNQRLKLFQQLFLAIGLTVLLTANVWGGMLELSLSNNLLPVAPGIDVSVTAPRVAGQSSGVLASSTASAGVGSGLNTLGVSVPFLLILLAILGYLVFNYKRMPKLTYLITATGVGFLYIASDYFPWHYLAHLLPSVDYIQFPSRFLVVAIVLMLLAFGMCLSNSDGLMISPIIKIGFTVYVLLAVQATSYQELQNGIAAYQSDQVVLPDRNLTISPLKPAKLRAMFNTDNLELAINAFNKPTPDYLPFFVKIHPDQYWVYHPYHLYKSQILTNLKPNNSDKDKQSDTPPVKKVVTDKGLEITWTNPLDHKWWISIPVIKYANTVVLIDGKRVPVDTSSIGKMFIDSKPGINHALIFYQSTWWYYLSVLATLITALALLINPIVKKALIYLKKSKIIKI